MTQAASQSVLARDPRGMTPEDALAAHQAELLHAEHQAEHLCARERLRKSLGLDIPQATAPWLTCRQVMAIYNVCLESVRRLARELAPIGASVIRGGIVYLDPTYIPLRRLHWSTTAAGAYCPRLRQQAQPVSASPCPRVSASDTSI